jgi:hypothetical protein
VPVVEVIAERRWVPAFAGTTNTRTATQAVIPAKAGIHFAFPAKIKMGSGFRRNDGCGFSDALLRRPADAPSKSRRATVGYPATS